MTDRAVLLDDLKVGQTWESGPIEMRESDIIRFAREYDPQPMHVDPEAAAKGRFGGLIASGWHVAAVVMRDFVDTAPLGSTPALGIQIDALQWLNPVRPGDKLHVRRQVIAIDRSRTKPDRGTVRMTTTVTNQDGAVAMSFVNLLQMPARTD